MRRNVFIFTICMFVIAFTAGCTKTLENHPALSMHEEGMWEQRYNTNVQTGDERGYAKVSINVKKDMDEDDMLKILDYYSLNLANYNFIKNKKEAVVYGVFYKGDTDEEIARFKYVDGKSVDFTEEEQYNFPTPEQHSSLDDEEE